MEHQLLGQCKAGLIVLPDVHPLHLAGDGNDAEGVLRGVLFLRRTPR